MMSRYAKTLIPAVIATLLLGTAGVFVTVQAAHAQPHLIPGKALTASTPTPTPPIRACPYWSVSPGQNPGSQNQLYDIAAISARNVWAVGWYTLNSNTGSLIEHFDGSSWSVVSSPNAGTMLNALQSLAVVNANDIWAVGYWETETAGPEWGSVAEHWDGSEWSIVTSPANGYMFTSVSAVSTNDVWAVGSLIDEANENGALVEHWDGTAWSVVTIPLPGNETNMTSSVVALSADDVWIVGSYGTSGIDFPQPLAEHWNGTTWTVVPITNTGWNQGTLQSVAAVSSTDVWAVGYGGLTGSTNSQSLTEHWNGTTWSVVSSPNVGGNPTFLNAVTALSAGNIWAVGTAAVASPIYREPVVLHSTGSVWSVSPVPNPGAYSILSGVSSVLPGEVWAAGEIVVSPTPETSTSQGTIDTYNPSVSLRC